MTECGIALFQNALSCGGRFAVGVNIAALELAIHLNNEKGIGAPYGQYISAGSLSLSIAIGTAIFELVSPTVVLHQPRTSVHECSAVGVGVRCSHLLGNTSVVRKRAIIIQC